MNIINVMRGMDSKKVAEFIGNLNKNSIKKTAVLARNHVLLKKLSIELSFLGVEHTYIGRKTELKNTEEFIRFHAFLKLIVNPYCNMSFLLVKELMGVSEAEYKTIRHTAVMEGKSHFQVWAGWGVAEYFKDKEALEDALFGARGLTEDHGDGYGDAARFVSDWIHDHPTGTLSEYLSWLATYDLQDEMSEATDGLILATIHAAKGLEWPTVIIAGMNEGLLPSKQAAKNGEIEQERRLAYVAATRAEDTLILTVRPEVTETEHRTYHNPESRFVKEMMS